MESNKFTCLIHPKETIQRVLMISDASEIFYCIDCILTAPKHARDYLVPLHEVASRIRKEKAGIKSSLKFDISPPESLSDILNAKEAAMKNLTVHIEKQKEKINYFFAKLREDILDELEAQRKKCIIKFDAQISNLNANFVDYQARLGKHFNIGREKESERETPIEDIEIAIKNANNIQELEHYIRSQLTQIEESKALSKEETDEITLLQTLKSVKVELENVCKTLPTIANLQDDAMDQTVGNIITALRKACKDIFTIKDEIPISCAKSVTGLLKQDFKSYLSNLVGFSGSYELKFNGKRDGYDLVSIGKILAEGNKSLLILKTTDNDVIGFYTSAQDSQVINFTTRQAFKGSNFKHDWKGYDLNNLNSLKFHKKFKLKKVKKPITMTATSTTK